MTDDLPFDYPSPANPGAPAPRKCRHPKDRRGWFSNELGTWWRCGLCGHEADPARVSMGKTNRKRGNAKERASAKRNGTQRTGHHGGKDDYRVNGLFAVQNKSMATARFPGWMTNELDALRREWPNLEPVLHVEESPGPGRRARRIYVVDERTWFALHGKGDAE
jgi:hypothetical protein